MSSPTEITLTALLARWREADTTKVLDILGGFARERAGAVRVCREEYGDDGLLKRSIRGSVRSVRAVSDEFLVQGGSWSNCHQGRNVDGTVWTDGVLYTDSHREFSGDEILISMAAVESLEAATRARESTKKSKMPSDNVLAQVVGAQAKLLAAENPDRYANKDGTPKAGYSKSSGDAGIAGALISAGHTRLKTSSVGDALRMGLKAE